MKFQVTHRTLYRYGGPVQDSFNEARLHPTSNEHQECLAFELQVNPPARLSHYLDFYLNFVNYFEVVEPHEMLMVESRSLVQTHPEVGLAPTFPIPFKTLNQGLELDQCYDFLLASQYVSTEPVVWRHAVDICPKRVDIWETVQALSRHIYKGFAYASDATTVQTHMEEVLQHRSGVCQDFAHVLIGFCRCLKIPARYVSGYIYSGTEDRALRGAQASHAWCEVYLPGFGWVGLDPTNNQQVDDRYIKVAVGRDYADIAPVKGTYRGPGSREMQIDVHVDLLS